MNKEIKNANTRWNIHQSAQNRTYYCDIQQFAIQKSSLNANLKLL